MAATPAGCLPRRAPDGIACWFIDMDYNEENFFGRHAQKLRNKPLEYGQLFQTEIGSRPEELVAYLKKLA
jgi:hypothetical protein